MTVDVIFKLTILIVFILIIVSLISSFTFLVKDQGRTNRTVKSLTFRVILSVSLFVLLIVGFMTGMIKPHGVIPSPPAEVVQPPPEN